MKLTTHTGSTSKPQRMTLQHSPFVVWFDKKVEMHIHPGDTLLKVARTIKMHWSVDLANAKQIAACWFAVGERLARGNPDVLWTKAELSTSDERRYLRRSKIRA